MRVPVFLLSAVAHLGGSQRCTNGLNLGPVRTQPAQGRDPGQPQRFPLRARRQGRKLVAANAFGKINWASGIGRPIVTDVFKEALEGKNVTVRPSIRDQLI